MLQSGIFESLLFLGFCILYFVVQPATINRFYGYRTLQSKKSPVHWKFANKLASTILLISAVSSLLLCLLCEYVIKYNSQIVFLVFFMTSMVATIAIVEYRLRKI